MRWSGGTEALINFRLPSNPDVIEFEPGADASGAGEFEGQCGGVWAGAAERVEGDFELLPAWARSERGGSGIALRARGQQEVVVESVAAGFELDEFHGGEIHGLDAARAQGERHVNAGLRRFGHLRLDGEGVVTGGSGDALEESSGEVGAAFVGVDPA